MANRSHIYAFDRFENGLPFKPRGLHEWNWAIPPTHLVMMSGKPRTYMSSIVEGRRKVAVVADHEPGVARLLALLHALEATEALGAGFAADVRAAEQYLASDAGKGRFLLLEPFEIFQMSQTPMETQCATLVDKTIPAFAAQVDALVAKPPAQLFARAPKWLAEVRAEWNMKLGLGDWTPILFYRLDR